MNIPTSILITGVTGFIGSAIARCLATRQDICVRGVSRNLVPTPSLGIESIAADLMEEADFSDLLRGIDIVIHTAGRAHVMRDSTSDPIAEYRRANVDSTVRLARHAASAGVRRFVFISSVKVNGETTLLGYPFSADQAPSPTDAYAVSKYEAEIELFNIADETGLEVVVIRTPLVYGPGVKGNFAAMIRWVRKGMPLPLGAVNNCRSMVALENLVDFTLLCADCGRSPRAANEVFLVSDGEDVSTTEILRRVALAYGARLRLMPLPVSCIRAVARLLGKGHVADRMLNSLVVDSSPARELLGWKPVVSMDEQLNKMALHDSRN
jgi:nucleoside-diphosphate-sugar epimerase